MSQKNVKLLFQKSNRLILLKIIVFLNFREPNNALESN